MSARQQLLLAVDDAIDTHLDSGKVVDVDDLAERLLTRYPECGLAIDRIAKVVAEAAAMRGAALLSGARADRRQMESRAP